jgi:cold-inducible RNA-binding protein
MKNIIVGNLNSETKPEAIRSLFEPLGTVRKFKLMTYRGTGLSRGFAFVEMTEVEARQAIAALDGRIVDGQMIKVREGRPRVQRGPSQERVAPQRSEPPLL